MIAESREHSNSKPSASDNNLPLLGTFYSYRFIGNGAQFRVYAIYNHLNKPTGRVIKVPLDFSEVLSVISEPLRRLVPYDSEDEFQDFAYKRAKDILQYKHTLLTILQGAYGKDRAFMHSLGNLRILQAPILAPSTDSTESYLLPIFYTQDQVTTISTFWEHFTLAQVPYANELKPRDITVMQTLIDSMIRLNYMLWEYGFFEFVFKPENMGIRQTNKSFEVIWMDVAEHITDFEQAVIILQEKHWLHPLMTHKLDYVYMPSVLHDYYVKACDKAFTVAMLRKYWRRRSAQLENKTRRKLYVQSLFTRDSKKLVRLWIDQQTIKSSLYSGLLPAQIDNMQIPVEDLTKLFRDRRRLNGIDTADLNIERRLATTEMTSAPLYEQLLLHYLKEQS